MQVLDKELDELFEMGTEIASTSIENGSSMNTTNHRRRPFKLLVKNSTFYIDASSLREQSPIFAVMCYGKDFDNGREWEREIVDENVDDISIFVKCLKSTQSNRHHIINENNFATILRLADKYQVSSLISACEYYIVNDANTNEIKLDVLLTLLIASIDYHLDRKVIGKLVMRFAAEQDRSIYGNMKLNRLLPLKIYNAILSANVNLTQIRQIETMNGHVFRIHQSIAAYTQRGCCELCRRISDRTSKCGGCRKILCDTHWKSIKCTSDYGTRMLVELKSSCMADLDSLNDEYR